MDQVKKLHSKLSITCTNVPAILLERVMAKRHFGKFGKVLRIRFRPKQSLCVVEFSKEADARRAFQEAGKDEKYPFRVSWTVLKSPEKKDDKKKKIDPNRCEDSEVQKELEAMQSYTSRVYNSRPSSLQSSPHAKKKTASPKIEKGRKWKSEISAKSTESSSVSSDQSAEQTQELLSIISKPALTSEEKYKVLDARDKLIRLKTVKQVDLKNRKRTIGTCPDMCPEKERLMREAQHQVALYEQASGGKGSMNHVLAVKQYSRSSADQDAALPHELRPVEVLKMTMGYLLHRIMDLAETPDVNIADWYNFVWDRTRSIRKDITQQELCCEDSVTLVEQCARFHIHCAARLVAEDLSVFDQKINTENLTKCLQTLKYMYHDLGRKNIVCKNEAEFRGYIVLLNVQDGNFMWELKELPKEIQQSPPVKFALEVVSAITQSNYVKFFKLVRSTSYLNACLLFRYFNQVRTRAVKIILKSFSPRQPSTQYPLEELKGILAFEDIENTAAFVEYFGLNLNDEKTHVVLNRNLFQLPDSQFSLERAVRLIESKRLCSVGEIVCGAPLPEKLFEFHKPFNSFDESGYLKRSEIPVEYRDDLSLNSVELSLSESDMELETPSAEEKPNFTFMFSPPITEVAPKFNLPKVSTNYVFPPANTVTEKSEVDGTLKSFIQPKPDVVQDSFKAFVKPFEVEKTEKVVFTTSPFSNKLSETPSIFKQSISTNNNIGSTIVSNISFPISPLKETALKFNVQEESEDSDYDDNEESYEEMTNNAIEELKAQMKLEDERRAKEEQRRKEEALARKHLEEKRQRELEEKKRREFALVTTIVNELIDNVEEKIKRDTLKTIRNKIKWRKIKVYFDIWRKFTQATLKKRKVFFDCSTWISLKSLKTEAAEMRMPRQNETLGNMKRYRLGTPTNLQVDEKLHTRTFEIYESIKDIFLERCRIQQIPKPVNIYWKVIVSIPEMKENYLKYFNVRKASILLDLVDNSVHVRRFYMPYYGYLSYSLEKFNKAEPAIHDANGIIFIINSDIVNETIQRFKNVMVNRKNISVVFVIINCMYLPKTEIHKKFEIDLYKSKQIISHVETLHDLEHTEKNVQVMLNLSLMCLAENTFCNYNYFNIEMNFLDDALKKSLLEDFYVRLVVSCKKNSRLNEILQNPKYLIMLHNEAVQRLKKIFFDKAMYDTPYFPKEFNQYLPKQTNLPCTYEHFPAFWKDEKYTNKIKKIFQSLLLPTYEKKSPKCNSFCTLKDLEEYCQKIFSDVETVVGKITSMIYHTYNDTKNISWIHVLPFIVEQNIHNIAKLRAKNSESYFVFYDKKILKEFLAEPWWYNIDFIEKRISAKMSNTNTEITKVDREELELTREDSIDVDAILRKLDELTEKKIINRHKFDRTGILKRINDLETSTEISRIIINKHERILNNLL